MKPTRQQPFYLSKYILFLVLFISACSKDTEEVLFPSDIELKKELQQKELTFDQAPAYLEKPINSDLLITSSKARSGEDPPVVSRGDNPILTYFSNYLTKKKGSKWYRQMRKKYGVPLLAFAHTNKNEEGYNIAIPVSKPGKKFLTGLVIATYDKEK